MWSTLVIFAKELREISRDRKTLVFMIALPILVMPLVLDVGLRFAQRAEDKARSEVLEYALFDGDKLPALTSALTDDAGFTQVPLAEPQQIRPALESGTIDFALVVRATEPAGDRAGPAGGQIAVELHYNNASQSHLIQERVSEIVTRVSEAERSRRLVALGVNAAAAPRLLTPVVLEERGIADIRAVLGEQIGGILPYLFLAFCFLGAFYPSIDLGAGEKERGTLETLLLAPVSRHHIVLGKFLLIFLASNTAAMLSLISLGVWLGMKGGDIGGVLGAIIASVGVLDLALIALMLVPMAAIFAAVLLAISIYANSFKEAQSYSAPLQLVLILPAAIPMLPGVEMSWGWSLVPITNIALAVKELVKGTMDYAMLVAIFGSTAMLAGILLGFCTWWFCRESVLFRR